MEKEDGGSAFPHSFTPGETGMSLRDWFAGRAMQGFMAHYGTQGDRDVVAVTCYSVADRMLIERGKG